MAKKKKVTKKPSVKCPRCNEGTYKDSIAKGFKSCSKCFFVHVSKRKSKKLWTKTLGLHNKTLDEAIVKLTDIKDAVPEGAVAKIVSESTYSYAGGSTAQLKIHAHLEEDDEEVYLRMVKAEERATKAAQKKKVDDDKKAVALQKEKEGKEGKERRKLIAEKKAEKKKKDREKIEKFFTDHGLSVDTVKEVLMGR